MAYSLSNRFGNVATPAPQLAGPFNKFSIHTTPKYQIGFKVEQADGSVYRYGHFGAATTRGLLVSTDVSESSVADTDNIVIAPASAVAVAGDNTQVGAIGSRYAEVTLAAISVNQYAGGKLIVTDDTGEGYTYDIIGNTATGDPASGNIRLTLGQKLQVALTTTSDISICGSPYANLEAATTTDANVVGVTCAVMTQDSWGWIQSRGTAGVLTDAIIPVIGAAVELSLTIAGGVTACQTAGIVGTLLLRPIVGYCVDPGDSTGHSAINLMLS